MGLRFGGKLGVNIFVIISVYFMINKSFKLSRVLNLIFQATFYSIIFLIISAICGENISFYDVIYSIFPVIYDEWQFLTSFILLMLFVPILNQFIKSISKNQLKWGIIISVIVISFFYYFNLYIFDKNIEPPPLNYFVWFIILYCIGSYFRLYDVKIDKKLCIIAILTFLLLAFVMSIIYYDFMHRQFTIFNLIFASLVFLLFKDFKFKSKIINIIASTTFGIFLIHEQHQIRKILWQDWLIKFDSLIGNKLISTILLSMIVFIVACIIDLIRKNTIHRLTNKFLKYVDKKTEKQDI